MLKKQNKNKLQSFKTQFWWYQSLVLTLIDDVKTRLVLGIVTVEEQSCLMRGAEERVGDHWAAESINYFRRLMAATAHLQIVMNRFCWEVKKLQMDP